MKEVLEGDGIKTKSYKKQMRTEITEKMREFDLDRDQKLAQVREDYVLKIKAAKNPQDKERLLEEMGRRLKAVDEQLKEERKRQESNLKKMLK